MTPNQVSYHPSLKVKIDDNYINKFLSLGLTMTKVGTMLNKARWTEKDELEFQELLAYCQRQVMRQFGVMPEVKPLGQIGTELIKPHRRRLLFDF